LKMARSKYPEAAFKIDKITGRKIGRAWVIDEK